jgi:hypothetical protein
MVSWLSKVGSAAYSERIRSYEQKISCILGTAPVLTAKLERVRIYEDQHVDKEYLGEISISMAELVGQDLLDAQVIQEKLTHLIGDRVMAIL